MITTDKPLQIGPSFQSRKPFGTQFQQAVQQSSSNSTSTVILNRPLRTGAALSQYLDQNPKLNRQFESFHGEMKSRIPVAEWGGIVFSVPREDIEKGHTTLAEAEAAAKSILEDMARTTAGAYVLERMDKKHEGKKHQHVVLAAGYPKGGGDRVTDQSQEHLVVEGHADRVSLSKTDPKREAGPHGVNNGVIIIPFQYARYTIKDGEDWNKDPTKPRIASSPSEVLLHEFAHDFNSRSFVKGYLNKARQQGEFVDTNQNGVHDQDEFRHAWSKATHGGFFGLNTGANAAIFMEKAFVFEKYQRGFTDHHPRPDDNLMGEKQLTIGVRVDDPSQVKPSGQQK